MPNKTAIVFVDDEPKILSGLRRLLRGMRNEWDMRFPGSGAEVLDLLAQERCEIIVSDMRMPCMDGVELLTEVRERYPHIVRIALSGQASKNTVLRSIGLVHQYLAKPCDAEMVKSTLIRICALQDLLPNEDLRERLSSMKALPSIPSLYETMVEALESTSPSTSEIGRIVSQDLAISARILQLGSSAFFSSPTHLLDPTKTAISFGPDTLKALTLSDHAFSQFDQTRLAEIPIDQLSRHSRAVAECAKIIANSENGDGDFINHAFIAALLHDIGKLALAAEFPEQYASILAEVSDEQLITTGERERFGTTHAEVGAYLMGLWGLPERIVEAIAFHHSPMQSKSREFTPLTVTHVADALVRRGDPSDKFNMGSEIDEPYLRELGLIDRVPLWKELSQDPIDKETANV